MGAAKAIGLDIGLNYSPIDGLILGLSGNVSKSKYTESLPRAGIMDGDKVQAAPGYSVTLNASYDWPLTAALNGSVSAAYTMLDSTTTYSVYTPPLESDSYNTLNVRAGVHGKRWSVFLTAENLLNESAIRNQESVLLLNGGAPFYQPPRSVGIEASVNF